jgi:hypothetical protein
VTQSFRAASSAGATYPLKLYVVSGSELMIARYGDTGMRYVHMGAGNAAYKFYL